ncbi:hypothetical protein DVH05_018518 [Phytophthora capsici]|nr:hypothetical protein DVH05_018518 [Phytophthora capsici]
MDAEKLQSTIGNVMLYCFLQLVSLVVLFVVLWQKLRVSALFQLSFVLERQAEQIQTKLVFWVFYNVQAALEHFESPIESDAIIDTEHQMRAEAFAPQIFSPSKPAPAHGAINRIPRDVAIVSKFRGTSGDLIRKAIRKRNRDLTLLRSHGQHLLPQQGSHSSPTGIPGAVESIQERAYVVVVLQRRNPVTPYSVSYDCQIREVAAKLERSLPSVLRGEILGSDFSA